MMVNSKSKKNNEAIDLEFNNIMPGDKFERKITLNNDRYLAI